MSILWISLIALCLLHKSSSELPASVEKCHAGDGKCITKVINDILRNNPSGIAELGLANIDPIHIDELVVTRTDGDKSLSLDMKFIDLDIIGLSKSIVNRVEGFERDPLTSKFEMYLTMPEVTLRGKYETNGKILLIPIMGKGNAEVRLTNLKSGVKVKVNVNNKNGKLLLSVKQVKVQNEPEMMKVKLDNLFNGSKELGDELNKVINTNWKDVWTEMQDGINEAYGGVVKTIIEQVMRKIPYDEFFLNE